MVPVVGICTACTREFTAPMTVLKRLVEAQANLQQQFDQHTCRDSTTKS
jgi:hypothetical protein